MGRVKRFWIMVMRIIGGDRRTQEYPPRQVSVWNRRFEDHLGHHQGSDTHTNICMYLSTRYPSTYLLNYLSIHLSLHVPTYLPTYLPMH